MSKKKTNYRKNKPVGTNTTPKATVQTGTTSSNTKPQIKKAKPTLPKVDKVSGNIEIKTIVEPTFEDKASLDIKVAVSKTPSRQKTSSDIILENKIDVTQEATSKVTQYHKGIVEVKAVSDEKEYGVFSEVPKEPKKSIFHKVKHRVKKWLGK